MEQPQPFKKKKRVSDKNLSLSRKIRGYVILAKGDMPVAVSEEEFLEHYHKRSNSETCFHMIKTKFGSHIKSKKQTAQFNELLVKVLCHNICVVIQEVNELGVKAEFKIEETLER